MQNHSYPVFSHDIFSDESVAEAHRFDSEMREAGPVVWLEKCSSWFVGRHDEVRKVYGDPATYSSKTNPFNSNTELTPPILLSDDAPVHTKDRAAILTALSPAALKAGSHNFDAVADDVVGRLIDEGEGNAYRIAADFVLKAFPDMLGLPAEGRETLIDFGQAILNSFGAPNARTMAAIERAGPGFQWVMTECAREKVSENGLAAKIYQLSDQGKVSEQEAGLLVRAVLAAGFDTTILSITSAVTLLAKYKDQWDLVKSDPAILRNAFEETLRYVPPGRYSNRVMTKDHELSGVLMKKGDQIALALAAAGRDPRKWDNPDRFDVTRRAAGHLAFGFGIHACIGQVLARLEYEALVGAMARRIDKLELTAEPAVMMNNVTTGYASAPLRVTAQ